MCTISSFYYVKCDVQVLEGIVEWQTRTLLGALRLCFSVNIYFSCPLDYILTTFLRKAVSKNVPIVQLVNFLIFC